MNCFYHNHVQAVGICKSCNKGVCAVCAVDVGNGIACKNLCEKEVEALNKIFKNSSMSYKASGKSYKYNALIYGFLGFTFTSLGIFGIIVPEHSGQAFFTLPVGLIFLAGAFLSYKSGKQITNASN